MAKNNNLGDLLKSVADAIRAKKGSSALINPQNFDSEIASIPVSNEYGNTGTVDAEGLQELGWNQNDIDWLQKVCWWDEEDNDKWKVSEANKTKGKLITWNNYSNYQNDADIVFFPKLERKNQVVPYFAQWTYVAAIPTDGWTSNNRDFGNKFNGCYLLRSIGNFTEVINTYPASELPYIYNLCNHCYQLRSVGDTPISFNVEYNGGFGQRLQQLRSLKYAPTGVCRQMDLFSYPNLKTLYFPSIRGDVYAPNSFADLTNCLENIPSSGTIYSSLNLSPCPLLTRESCLVLFNALDADNPNTITLHANAKARLSAEDIAIATNKGWTIA